MKEKGVGVAGVVLDTTGMKRGNQDGGRLIKKQAFFRKKQKQNIRS